MVKELKGFRVQALPVALNTHGTAGLFVLLSFCPFVI